MNSVGSLQMFYARVVDCSKADARAGTNPIRIMHHFGELRNVIIALFCRSAPYFWDAADIIVHS